MKSSNHRDAFLLFSFEPLHRSPLPDRILQFSRTLTLHAKFKFAKPIFPSISIVEIGHFDFCKILSRLESSRIDPSDFLFAVYNRRWSFLVSFQGDTLGPRREGWELIIFSTFRIFLRASRRRERGKLETKWKAEKIDLDSRWVTDFQLKLNPGIRLLRTWLMFPREKHYLFVYRITGMTNAS
mgnify:CR=1 FL=1